MYIYTCVCVFKITNLTLLLKLLLLFGFAPFSQIIIFIYAEIIFINCIFGIHLLIILMENVASIFAVRNYLQQVTDEEQVLLN